MTNFLLCVTTLIMTEQSYRDKRKYDQCVRDIGILLQRHSHIFQRMEREQHRATGFTGSQSFLLILLLDRREMSKGEIGDTMNLEKSSVSRLITPLERDSLVETRSLDEDRRLRIVRLTPKGKMTARAVKETREAYYRQVISHLPRGHVREVMESAETLTRALEQIDI